MKLKREGKNLKPKGEYKQKLEKTPALNMSFDEVMRRIIRVHPSEEKGK